MPAPLAHLRVVDLTDLRGAFAGRLLADLGADVVKVEPARGGARPARRRRLAPFLPALRARRHPGREPRPRRPAASRPDARRSRAAPSAPGARRDRGPGSLGSARRLAARVAASVRRLGGAPRLGVPGPSTLLAPRLR